MDHVKKRGSFWLARPAFSAIVVATFLLVSTAFPVLQTLGGRDGGHVVSDSSTDEPRPNQQTFTIQVTNPTSTRRKNEVMRQSITLENWQITDPTDFLVKNKNTGLEVLSGSLPLSVEYYPSGFVHRMDVVFQDSFAPMETKSYDLEIGSPSALTGDLIVRTSGGTITVRDGTRTYTLQTLHDLSHWSQGVYVQYSNSSHPTIISSILVRVGGDQLSLDQTNFQMAWGTPTWKYIEYNNVMASIHLSYEKPIMVNWGVGSSAELYKDTDVISANVTMNIYNDREMIETFTQKKVNEKFYNHNGYVVEFTNLYAGQGQYEQIFGNEHHTIMYGRTRAPTWAPETPVFKWLDRGNRTYPALGNLDGDLRNTVDIVVGSEDGTLLFIRNTGTAFSPSWKSDPSMFDPLGSVGNYTCPELADLDGDGDLDLTIGLSNGTLAYYENTGTPTVPQWTLNTSMFPGIDVGNFSAPAFADVDNDTDLDLVIGDESGRLSYFNNTGDSASPIWTEEPTMFQPLGILGNNTAPELEDIDRDGDVDLIVGVKSGVIYDVENVGNASVPSWSLNSTTFAGIDVGGYAAPELADLTSNGVLDLITGEANGSLFYYGNDGSPAQPLWTQSNYIYRLGDLGERASPFLVDLDNDGDMDLAVGQSSGTVDFYENVGSKRIASWRTNESMFAGISVGSYSSPELADLDGDLDYDLTLGSGDGTLSYFENIGNRSSPSWLANSSMFSGVAVANFSSPAFADLDSDGDLDLAIGQGNGKISYYENVGNASVPVWRENSTLFGVIDTGNTRKPGRFSTPVFADVDRDGDLDFISGQDDAAFGSLVLFFNTGTKFAPIYTQLYPAMFNNVRGGATDGTRDYSCPAFGDLDGDSDLDLTIGTADGYLTHYLDMDNSSSERHFNTMEPLENGSYRFYYDQDGNDGQYVIRDTTRDFFDYYVVANPNSGDAVLRYIPQFKDLVYRDRYAGDEYPWAGGNVSYYPFLPDEDGYVTRGIVISHAFSVSGSSGMSAGTFLSQTGTAGGFIQVAMAPKPYDSHEILIPDLVYTTDYSAYDDIALRLGNPMIVLTLPDLKTEGKDIQFDPADPGDGDIVVVSATVENLGWTAVQNVTVDFYDGDPGFGGLRIGGRQKIASIDPRGVGTAAVKWDTTGLAGPHDIYVTVDKDNLIIEMDEGNNVGYKSVEVTNWTRMWSPPFQVTSDLKNSLDPVLVEDSNGRMWIAYHTYTTHDNFDIFVRNWKNMSWSPEQLVVEKSKRTSQPSLAADGSGNVWLVYSSNIDEYNKFITTKSGIYYWSQKFDIYSKKFNGTNWEPSVRVTRAVESNNSDQTPIAVFDGGGRLWAVMRHTHFQLYTKGYQMYNIPYQDMNITSAYFDGVTWNSDVVNNDLGSQGWWGGPAATVNATGTIWVAYGSEIAQQQWDIFAQYWTGSAWSAPMRVTSDPAQDIRPALTTDGAGRLWVIWESNRTGNKDLFARFYDGTWSPLMQLTTDLGRDVKCSATTDVFGDVWIAWESDRTGNQDIFAKRFDGGWSPDFQVTVDKASDEEPFIASSPSTGSIWIAWESDRNGIGNLDIYVKTVPDVIVWPDRTVKPPENLSAHLEGLNFWDLNITWNLSADDGLGENDIVAYDIYCGPSYDSSGSTYLYVDSVPAGRTYYVLAGGPTPSNAFCYVEARDDFNNTARAIGQVGIFSRFLTSGPNLVSIPLVQEDWRVGTVLQSLDFKDARWYDASDKVDRWKAYHKGKGYSDLRFADLTMALWVNVTTDGYFVVGGVVPSNVTIDLRKGWNLVGFPSFEGNYTLADLRAVVPVERAEGFDASAPPFFLRVLQDSDSFRTGFGYWIRASGNAPWVVPNI